MLITQAFQWIAPFSGWLLFIPPVLFVICLSLHFWRAKKIGRENDEDYLGFFGILAMISMVLTILVPILWGASGSPTHTTLLEEDFAEQFNIQHVDREYIDGEYRITGKDPDGKYVICTLKETRSEDTFQVSCDNGKDNWKGPNDGN